MAAILSLALGIGVTTGLFMVLNAVVLRPLPFHEPDQLVWITQVLRGSSTDEVTITADFFDWRRSNRSFSNLAAYNHQVRNLTGVEPPIEARTVRASACLLSMLGVSPAIGRGFQRDEDVAGHDGVAILTHEFWQRRFGGEHTVLGRTLTIDARPFTVVGVLPENFVFPGSQAVDILTPLGKDESREMQRREYATIISNVIGRLKPGVSLPQARAELTAIQSHLPNMLPWKPKISIEMLPLHERLFGNTAAASYLLLGAAALLLLIACANVSNLLLVRLAQRQREISMRTALGCSRGRLIVQLLTESGLLGVLGCTGGVLLAVWLRKPLIALGPVRMPGLDHLPFDWRVLVFAVTVGMTTTMLFGGLPALRAAKSRVAGTMKSGGAGAIGGRRTLTTLSSVAMAEIALTIVLSAGAGLVVQSFWRMRYGELGFRPDGLVVATLHVTGPQYRRTADRVAFIDQLLDRANALPGVESATVTAADEIPPGHGRATNAFQIEGRVKDIASRQRPIARFQQVSAGLFGLMNIPLLNGRLVRDNDPDIVINRALAEKYFPREDPIGHRIVFGEASDWRTIVGVVGDVKTSGLAAAPEPAVYYSYRRAATSPDVGVILRSRLTTRVIAGELRRAVADIDPNQPLATVETMNARLSTSVSAPRFAAAMLTAFASLALLLGIVGVYGVMACRVRWQSRELALRQALGASPEDLIRMVLQKGLWVVIPGVMAGLAATLAAGHLLASLLYGVKANDPLTLAIVSVLLLGAGLAACYVPALKAGRGDLATVLREE